MIRNAAASDAVRVEKFAAILDRYALTRLEFADDTYRIVLEKSPVSTEQLANATQNTNAGQASSTMPGDAATEALALAGATKTAQAEPSSARSNKTSPELSASGLASDPLPAEPLDKNVPQDFSSSDNSQVTIVSAPLVGIAYRAKEPGQPAFAEVGDTVKIGETLCLIEAMKMFSEVTAPMDGIIKAIHFEDATLVEHGAPLFSLE